jgi:hypothetical protein
MFSRMRPPKLRTMRAFAESEIILPEGPRAGLPFSCQFAPFTGLILDVFDSGKFRRHWVSGPVQSGKSLIGLVVPVLYHLFEVGENVILCAPTQQIAQGVRERLRFGGVGVHLLTVAG